jgi:hypothetical protein
MERGTGWSGRRPGDGMAGQGRDGAGEGMERQTSRGRDGRGRDGAGNTLERIVRQTLVLVPLRDSFWTEADILVAGRALTGSCCTGYA